MLESVCAYIRVYVLTYIHIYIHTYIYICIIKVFSVCYAMILPMLPSSLNIGYCCMRSMRSMRARVIFRVCMLPMTAAARVVALLASCSPLNATASK